jgi:enamine deaminase RidA (YjgF/YER057c/UK114 family)
MTNTSNHSVPDQGIFRRAFAAMWSFLEALESGGSGYTLGRIDHLEREVGGLKEELRQSRDQSIPSRAASVSRRNPMTMWDMASLGWSQISVAEPGRLAFLSGQIASAPGRGGVPEDLAGQAKLATASLASALKELKASAQDIVMLRVYVVNATMEAFGQAIAPLRELAGDAMPSITTIGVQALYTPELKVEIEMVVRLP